MKAYSTFLQQLKTTAFAKYCGSVLLLVRKSLVQNGTARFKKWKQLFEYKHLLSLSVILVVKAVIYT